LGEKILQYHPLSWKRYEISPYNGKSQVADLSLSVSMILSDLETLNAKGQTSQLRTNCFT